ncbi:hypothetical protein PO124_09655 [Bacillus licheniformis]|nr:hypothetical protein [Bacillus licheniformis]
MIISVLTILAIGPQYFLIFPIRSVKSSFKRTSFVTGRYADSVHLTILLCSRCSAWTYISRRFGIRNSYLTLITLFYAAR